MDNTAQQNQNQNIQSPTPPAQPNINPNPQTPPVQPMENAQTPPPLQNPQSSNVGSKKKFSLKLIIGIIIFLLLAGGVTGYVYRGPLMNLVSQPTSSPSPSPTEALGEAGGPTTGWQTYEGDGFTFKYPSEKFTVEKSGFSYQIIPLFINRNSVFDIINIKSLIITPEELNLLYENKVRSLEDPISTPLKNGNKIVGNGNRQTHFYDGKIMYVYLNSPNTFLEISSFNEETFNYLDEILETLEFTERSQENYKEALDYEVEVLKSELWAASSRYYNTFSSFPWQKAESCKDALELQSTQEIETGILKPCINVLVEQGELQTYYLDLSNILLSSVLVSRLDNEIMACSMPRSIKGQSDPDTSYDKSGTKKSTCKSSGGSDDCYKCTNISY